MAPKAVKRKSTAGGYGPSEKRDFHVYDKVFAKMRGYPPWPAKITNINLDAKSKSIKSKCEVYFYGTDQLGQCMFVDIHDYEANKERFKDVCQSSKNLKHTFIRALEEIEADNGPLLEETGEAVAMVSFDKTASMKKSNSGPKRKKLDTAQTDDDDESMQDTNTEDSGSEEEDVGSPAPRMKKVVTAPLVRRRDSSSKVKSEVDGSQAAINSDSNSLKANKSSNSDSNTLKTNKSRNSDSNTLKTNKSINSDSNTLKTNKSINSDSNTLKANKSINSDSNTLKANNSDSKTKSNKSDSNTLKPIEFTNPNSNTIKSNSSDSNTPKAVKSISSDSNTPKAVKSISSNSKTPKAIKSSNSDSNTAKDIKSNTSNTSTPKVEAVTKPLNRNIQPAMSVHKDTPRPRKSWTKSMDKKDPSSPSVFLASPCLPPNEEVKQAPSRSSQLRTECTLLALENAVREALTVHKADFEKALSVLQQMLELDLTALMLKKNPQVIDTFRKLERYYGDRVKRTLDSSAWPAFESQAAKVRALASRGLGEVFPPLFTIPGSVSFIEHYRDELVWFLMKTADMPTSAVLSLTTHDSCVAQSRPKH